jgi:hypothetical protein
MEQLMVLSFNHSFTLQFPTKGLKWTIHLCVYILCPFTGMQGNQNLCLSYGAEE